MKWITDNPKKSGNYVVETKTTQGSIQRFEATYTVSEKDPSKGTWGFTDQLFQRWLDESQTETLIVAIPVNPYHNARKVCELIQNQVYQDFTHLREHLNNELEIDGEDDGDQPSFYNLNDFMDECNNEYFNLENYFISYVQKVER
jgi:hypothetical protein